jgi:hypothetical protein
MSEQYENPLLSNLKLPGETFTLPSCGVFYGNGELDDSVKNGEIHVYPMTTLDEIVIKTPDLLFSGQAVHQIFHRCIPQILNVGQILAIDVDFLLLCLRKVSYGNELQIVHTHTCENAVEHNYIVDIQEFIKNTKRVDPTKIINDYNITLPSGQVVNLNPIRFDDFVEIMQATNNSRDLEDPEQIRDIMAKAIANVIHDVNGTSNREFIIDWLKKVPPLYVKKLNEKIDSSFNWGPTFKTKITCLDCNTEVEIEVPTNPLTFFI